MAQYSRTVLTDAGVILARRMMDETITMEFTRIVTGDGQYSSGEDLAARTALKSQKQSFPLSSRSLTDEDRVLHLKYVISNVNPDSSPLTVGYYVREVGIYAHVTGESEILYAVAIADADAADYLPEYDELQPSTITMDWFITVGNTENITIQASPSAYALAEDLEELAEVVDQKLDANGDSKNNTVTFTSSDVADGSTDAWTNVTKVDSGETHKSLFAKMSQMFKNVRYLYKLLGTTDISSIGDGTVTKALSVLNANFGKILNSDAELDALSGTCFFGGSYSSTYFGALDYNGVQIDNAQQRTQIVVVTSNLLYRVEDIGTGHEGNWSEWNAIPYNTATLLNSLNNDVANISSLLFSNGETFKFIV
ncbi:MAG: hypothetical protein J5947_03815, partial [Clostridium sp.]|nr:hypothetical protein [Clostridium sp.]